jgi:hypothetical protein
MGVDVDEARGYHAAMAVDDAIGALRPIRFDSGDAAGAYRHIRRSAWRTGTINHLAAPDQDVVHRRLRRDCQSKPTSSVGRQDQPLKQGIGLPLIAATPEACIATVKTERLDAAATQVGTAPGRCGIFGGTSAVACQRFASRRLPLMALLHRHDWVALGQLQALPLSL